MKKLILASSLALSSLALVACGGSSNSSGDSPQKSQQDSKRQFGIFTVQADNKTVVMDGDIKTKTLTNFNKLQEKYPNITTINIKNCGGSLDDTANLKLSHKVHQSGINIHLMDNAEIASGGVDFFLAGIKRTRGNKTKIGVHSWGGDGESATDYPKGHKYHLPYIKYYKSVGMSQQQAEDFYYFTIYSAPANGIHWMTEAEIKKYQMITG